MLFHPSVEETFIHPLFCPKTSAPQRIPAPISAVRAPQGVGILPVSFPDARTPTATVHPAIGIPHHPLTFREATGQLSVEQRIPTRISTVDRPCFRHVFFSGKVKTAPRAPTGNLGFQIFPYTLRPRRMGQTQGIQPGSRIKAAAGPHAVQVSPRAEHRGALSPLD